MSIIKYEQETETPQHQLSVAQQNFRMQQVIAEKISREEHEHQGILYEKTIMKNPILSFIPTTMTEKKLIRRAELYL